MRKNAIVALLLGSLFVGGSPMAANAAGLGRLLGARPAVTARSSGGGSATVTPAVSRRPKARPVAGTPAVSDNLFHGTPKFPILNKLIKLYLLWLLFNPYR